MSLFPETTFNFIRLLSIYRFDDRFLETHFLHLPDSISYEDYQGVFNYMTPGQIAFTKEGSIFLKKPAIGIFIRLEDKLCIFNNFFMVVVRPGDVVFYDTEAAEQEAEEVAREIYKYLGPQAFQLSHYQYIDMVLDECWIKFTGKSLKDSWNQGISVAHGDKGYSHKGEWKDKDIPFFHAMVLFLLSYTPVFTYETYRKAEWVVDVYPKYKKDIEEIEQKYGFTHQYYVDTRQLNYQ